MIIKKNYGEKNMKKIITILIGISILFLLLGSAAAFEINSLKTLPDYTAWDANGYSNYTTNSNRYFCVEKIGTFDDDFKDEWFNNHPEYDYTTETVGNNIYKMADNNFKFYGYQEVVEDGGDYYMVSINQNSKMSPSEETSFLNDLKEFNKLNNLEPVAI